MRRYYAASLILSILAFAAWLICFITYRAPTLGDGNGPDPLGVFIYLATFPVGFLLLHSTVLAWALRKRDPATVLGGRRGLAIHAMLWLVFCGWLLYASGTVSLWIFVIRMRMS